MDLLFFGEFYHVSVRPLFILRRWGPHSALQALSTSHPPSDTHTRVHMPSQTFLDPHCVPIRPNTDRSRIYSLHTSCTLHTHLCVNIHLWPCHPSKYWNSSLSISPSNEYSGLISFRIDWLYLLVVQGTLKSLLQLHSSKASILRHSAFFMVQLSYPYITTGKTIALTIHTLVSKVMALLFNTLSRLVKALLPRGRFLSISWLQSLSTVILEPKKIMKVKSFCKSGLLSLAVQ